MKEGSKLNFIIIISIITLIILDAFITYVMRHYLTKCQQTIIFCCLAFMSIFELIRLEAVPGFFGDEAYAMYDSWSLAHFGIDRQLMHNAIYSLTSGGQSVLYEHLTISLMKLFGMNLSAFRFPMAFLTVFSVIFLVYALYRNKISNNITTGITFSLCTAQWLLMYGHWTMDCNIAVPLFILMIDFILIGFSGRKYNLYLGIVIMILLTYSYVGLWIALPFIYVFTLWLLYKEKKFNKLDILTTIGISLILLTPIFCYVVVQFFNVPKFKFLWFSVAPLGATRAANSMVSFKTNGFFTSILSNVVNGISILITGVAHTSTSSYTSVPYFGIFYLINFIFLVYAFYRIMKQKKHSITVKYLICISLAIVPIILFVQAGFWHWPSVFLIANIWSGIGLGLFLQSHVKKISKLILICVLLFETGSFTHYYFTNYAKDEIKANQLGGYSINYKQSKKFIDQLKELHVDTYYGIPFYNVSFMGCLIPTRPQNLNALQNKWQSNIPNEIQPQSAAYIVPENQKDNFQFLQGLPYKKMNVNYTEYIVYYNK